MLLRFSSGWLDCLLLSSIFSSPLAALPCILCCSPSPVFASYSLNRLAHCQSRGLLWLRHKSARKNRNHLFKSRPECGWVYKYRSLGLAPILHTDAHMTRRSSYGVSPTVCRNEKKRNLLEITVCARTLTHRRFSRGEISGKAFLCAVIGGKPLPCQISHPPEIFCRWKHSEMSHNSKLTLSVSLAPWHTLFSSA